MEYFDSDRCAKLVKSLENAINNKNANLAGEIAFKVAESKVRCAIHYLNEAKIKKNSIAISLKVTVESEGQEDHRFHIDISPHSSIEELKQMIETQYAYPTERQSVFFGKDIVKDDDTRLLDIGCESGVVICLKKNFGRKASSSEKGKWQQTDVKQAPETKLQRIMIGWKCEICTFVNKPSRPGCEICGAERPQDYVIPKQFQDEEKKRLLLEEEQLKKYEEGVSASKARKWELYQKLENEALVKNVEQFDCGICLNPVGPGEGIQLHNCIHQFCLECLRQHVIHCETAEVKCPYQDDQFSCENLLEEREIKQMVDAKIVDRLLNRSLATAESQSKDSFHCKTVNCKGWCFYEDGVTNFLCDLCKHDNCIFCQAIHENMNCKQYQDRLETLARTDEEAKKTKLGLERMLTTGEAMRCPQCNVIIIKNGGCDGLNCANCHVALCWATKGLRWGPKGNGDTSGGCRCRNPNVCHPTCQNCH